MVSLQTPSAHLYERHCGPNVCRPSTKHSTRGRPGAHQAVDNAIELVKVAALFYHVTVYRVSLHFAVTETPGLPALGIEPDKLARALANLAQAPVVRKVVIVAPVAQHDDRGLLVDRGNMFLEEQPEGAPKVGMRIDVDDLAAQRQLQRRRGVVLAKMLGDLADIGDEYKAAHARVEVLQCIHELQHEARYVAHRIGHVAKHHHLRLFAPAAIELQLERHAAAGQAVTQSFLDVEAAAPRPPSAHRDDIFESLCQASYRLIHPIELIVGQISEAFF